MQALWVRGNFPAHFLLLLRKEQLEMTRLAPQRESDEFCVRVLNLVIPRTPPSVNHYKKRARNGHWFVTEEAQAFKSHIWHAAGGKYVRAKAYQLAATVYLGKNCKGDGDNFWKVIADGLKDAQVIHSDAAVTDWIMRVRRDRDNPRTEIEVTAL